MINPFDIKLDTTKTDNDLSIPKNTVNITEFSYNPFTDLVKKEEPLINSLSKDFNKYKPLTQPLTASTYNVRDYIKKGFKLTDLDLDNPFLENDLSSTQSKTDRFINNLKVTGANLASSAISTFLTNPFDLPNITNKDVLADNTIDKKLFDWSNSIAIDNNNFKTRNDDSDEIWENITNWINPLKNSTSGIGKLSESIAFGLGAGLGILGQEIVTSLATGGTGTIPNLVNIIQKTLNNSKYLEKALKVSNVAEKAALNLKNVVRAGEITESTADLLKTIYKSQVGSYSESLFEGLEGKETYKNQLIEDFKKIHGYDPDGEDLKNIEKESSDLGLKRMNLNRALLSATNFSQFNSLFKNIDAFKEGAELMAEKYGSKVIYENGKAILSTGKKVKSDWFDKGIGKFVKPVAEKAINLKSGELLKEGIQEGLEEGSQFFIDKALNNYYTWNHYNMNKSIGDVLKSATESIFTKEGLESIFTGAIAGSGQAGVMKLISNLNPEYKQSKELYQKQQEEYANIYDNLGNNLKSINQKYNELPIKVKKQLYTLFTNDSINGTISDKVNGANASINISDIKSNIEDKEQFNQLISHELFSLALPYIRNGNIDILKEQFKDYKKYDSSTFNSTFGLEENVDHNKMIDFYLSEFEKINKSFQSVNKSFSENRRTKLSRQEFKNLKTEIAFSLYNSDRLTESSKNIESQLGSELINKTSSLFSNPSKVLKDNNKRIKEIEAQLDIVNIPELKKEKDDLEQYNDFLMSLDENTSKEKLEKGILDFIINPINEKQGKQKEVLVEDKLNSVYYYNKILDRLKYNQDKLNRLLYSDNIEKEFTSMVEESEKLSKKQEEILSKIEKEISKDEEVLEDSKINEPEQVSNLNVKDLEVLNPEKQEELFKEEITKPKEKEQEIIEEVLEGDYNNIISKIMELLFIIDENGEVASITSETARNRVKVLSSFLNFSTVSQLKKEIEFKKWSSKKDISFRLPDEKFLYKRYPKEGINILHDGKSIGLIPLTKDLYVDYKELKRLKSNINNSVTIENITINNQTKEVVSYEDFLDLLYSDKELEKTVRRNKFILNEDKYNLGRLTVSLDILKNDLSKFNNFIEDIKKLDIDKDKDIILNHIDLLAFFSNFKEPNYVSITEILPKEKLKDLPIFTLEIDANQDYDELGLYDSNNVKLNYNINQGKINKQDYLEIKRILTNYNIQGKKRFTFLRQKSKNGNSIYLIDANQKPIELYNKFYTDNISNFKTGEELINNLKNLSFVSEDNQIKFEYYDNNVQIIIEDKDNISKKYINYNSFENLSGKEIIDLLKKEIDLPITVFKSSGTEEENIKDYSNILVRSGFDKNNFQGYNSLYLVLDLNKKPISKKKIIKETKKLDNDITKKEEKLDTIIKETKNIENYNQLSEEEIINKILIENGYQWNFSKFPTLNKKLLISRSVINDNLEFILPNKIYSSEELNKKGIIKFVPKTKVKEENNKIVLNLIKNCL